MTTTPCPLLIPDDPEIPNADLTFFLWVVRVLLCAGKLPDVEPYYGGWWSSAESYQLKIQPECVSCICPENFGQFSAHILQPVICSFPVLHSDVWSFQEPRCALIPVFLLSPALRWRQLVSSPTELSMSSFLKSNGNSPSLCLLKLRHVFDVWLLFAEFLVFHIFSIFFIYIYKSASSTFCRKLSLAAFVYIHLWFSFIHPRRKTLMFRVLFCWKHWLGVRWRNINFFILEFCVSH